MNEKLASIIANQEASYMLNPHWAFDGQNIVHRFDKSYQASDIVNVFKPIFETVTKYFRLNYEAFQSEAQVLVLTLSDYEKLGQPIPTLSIESPFVFEFCGEELVIAVLPQQNTWGNTIVSEKFWQTQIANQHIFPIMRIHSHHILHAYQSMTDWSTLNSGTLEVVLGKVTNDRPEIAQWLDTRGEDTKDHVFFSDTNGAYWEQIKPGNKRVSKVPTKQQAEALLRESM